MNIISDFNRKYKLILIIKNNILGQMKILIHQCCGPCSLYPLDFFKKINADITAYFYNPNIHPVTEYYKRLETAVAVNEIYNIAWILEEDYGLLDFTRKNAGKEKERCAGCYAIRLEKTAAKAAELGFGYFTSTLLYSKMQNHELISETGRRAAERHGVKFYYHDFREGWEEGIKKSKELELYRQNYCGCIYSEMDRFLGQMSKKFARKYGANLQK